MQRVLFGKEDTELAVDKINPSFDVAFHRYIRLRSQLGSLAYNDMKKDFLETARLIVHAFNPDEWKDKLIAALSWGLVETCFRCKRLHPPVGTECDPKLSTEQGLAICNMKESDKKK